MKILLGIQCITIAIAFIMILKYIKMSHRDTQTKFNMGLYLGEARVIMAVATIALVGLLFIAQFFGLVPTE